MLGPEHALTAVTSSCDHREFAFYVVLDPGERLT